MTPEEIQEIHHQFGLISSQSMDRHTEEVLKLMIKWLDSIERRLTPAQ